MLLLFLLIISVTAFAAIRFSPLEWLGPVADKAHFFCLAGLPPDSSPELRALVCAENFPSLASSELYISTGLIHLFVVSGAHLVVIDQLLQKLPPAAKPRPAAVLGVLTVYGFLCGLNPPVVRSLAAFALNVYLDGKKITWPAQLKILVSGLVTLALNFHWVTSVSLQLSWLAGFLSFFLNLLLSPESAFLKQGLFFATLFPTLVFFQIPSGAAIVLNLILTPVLEFLLFPAGLMVWFLNPLGPIFDLLIRLLNFILKKTEMDFRPQLAAEPESLLLLNWALILFLHLAAHLHDVSRKRKGAP